MLLNFKMGNSFKLTEKLYTGLFNGCSYLLAFFGEVSEIILNTVDIIIPEKYVGQSEFIRGTREGIGWLSYFTSGEKRFSTSSVEELRSGGIRKGLPIKYIAGKPIDIIGGFYIAKTIYDLYGIIPIIPPIINPQINSYGTLLHDFINIPLKGSFSFLSNVFEESGYKTMYYVSKTFETFFSNLSDFILSLKLLLTTPGLEEMKEFIKKSKMLFHPVNYKFDIENKERKNIFKVFYKKMKTSIKSVYTVYKDHLSEKKIFPDFASAYNKAKEKQNPVLFFYELFEEIKSLSLFNTYSRKHGFKNRKEYVYKKIKNIKK